MKLILKNIEKSFGKNLVIEDGTFTFDQGYVYALLGRNGAGKTTLFKIINKSLEKDKGEVLLDDGEHVRPLEFEDCFFMVSEPQLPKFLTGREFLNFFASANKERIKDPVDIDELLSLVDFDLDDSNRLIQDYSTGMKNKLQMIMFMLLRPKLILMDEPLTSLDVIVQIQIKNLIRKIHKDHIIIFSTHILGLAKDICDKIVLLHGRKLQGVDELIKDDPDFEETVIKLLTYNPENDYYKLASKDLIDKKED
ncbi:MAG: ABC transporter ATP-binding protein [Anaerococcus sp.]|nr:ABC transporter ATP-binding protein [Anaerococcus sp.]